jgi:hypothetical protein
VETKNLDGETNLKQKTVPSLAQGLLINSLSAAHVDCELPTD